MAPVAKADSRARLVAIHDTLTEAVGEQPTPIGKAVLDVLELLIDERTVPNRPTVEPESISARPLG